MEIKPSKYDIFKFGNRYVVIDVETRSSVGPVHDSRRSAEWFLRSLSSESEARKFGEDMGFKVLTEAEELERRGLLPGAGKTGPSGGGI